MFSRRVYILFGVFALFGALIVARMAQVQLAWDDLFRRERYTRAGGDRILDTVRGGIYTRWGTPLAVQVPSFNLAVHYRRLLLGTPAPWKYRDVREIIDEFLRGTRPAVDEAARHWQDYPRAAGPGSDRYRRLWSAGEVRSRRYGSLRRYVRRRLIGESRARIRDTKSHVRPREYRDWRRTVSELTGVAVSELTETALDTVQRIDRIQRRVQRHSGAGPEQNYIRIVEQTTYHPVVKGVSAETAAAVRAEPDRFPGIRIQEGTRRDYPHGKLAPHLVGRVQQLSAEKWDELGAADRTWTMNRPVSRIGRRYTVDDRIGVQGVERTYEDLLRGRRGYVVNRWVFKVLRKDKQTARVPPRAGRDVYLTLRQDFQRAANRALQAAADGELTVGEGQADLSFDRGALLILEVDSGAVLAAATYPSYDAESLGAHYARITADPRRRLLFRPLQAALPTGSVYKIITALAAVEEGAVTANTTFECLGRQQFGDRYFHCTGFHRRIALVEAIEKSCNIYFWNAGLHAGGQAVTRWGRRLGLGVPTGVDWPYARSGRVPDATATHQVLNLSIGQGRLESTPLQVAGAMAALANGGRLYAPHFLDHARSPAEEVVQRYEPEYTRIPISPETLAPVRRGMERVVQSGTAAGTGVDRFPVAGKTGTAELGKSGLNHAWFAGYGPAEDPKIAFAVVNERVEGGHGGSHAAPILARCLEQIWGEVEAMP